MSRQRIVRHYANMLALDQPDDEAFAAVAERLVAAGYEGVQFIAPLTAGQDAICRAHGLGRCAAARVNLPAEAAPLAERCAGEGMECVTLHLGWGREDDAEAWALLEAVLEASTRWRIPLLIETHRATILQDMWRTVGFVRRYPELRFNGDFSHWYTGQEMVYSGFADNLAFLQPVVERVRLIHGRIGNPGHIQVDLPLDDTTGLPYVQDFLTMWRACLDAAPMDEPFWFVPELLSADIYYAPTVGSDRWGQMLLLRRLFDSLT